MLRRISLVFLAVLLAAPVFAADWSTTAISLLHGSGYKLTTPEEKSILTIEHADGTVEEMSSASR